MKPLVIGKPFSLAVAAVMMFVAAGAFAAAPVGQPSSGRPPQETPRSVSVDLTGSTRAPNDGVVRIREWFDELTHANASVRERARVALMGIKPEELGVLRDLVDRARPVAPAQAAVLHDVVIHVYLSAASERARGLPRGGFLGVLLEPMQSSSGLGLPPAPVPPAPADEVQDFGQFGGGSGGVLIRETWPGFAGFRFLRVGDVVIGTGRGQPARAPSVTEFKAAVSSTTPGRTIELQVLRQGRVIDIPVRVSARPAWAEDEPTTRQMQSRRLARAELYWRFAFALLLLDDGSMS